MPTFGRHHLLERAVRSFLDQGVPESELVIVSEDGVPATIAGSLASPRVIHVACPPGLTLGAKRNLACAAARGAVLVHWDDDDFSARDRLERQLACLRDNDVAVCGSSSVLFSELASGRCWEYRYAGEKAWVCGATLAYTREYWRRHPFESVNVGEDNRFVWAAESGEILDLQDPDLCVCSIHPGNTSEKNTDGPWWRPVELPAQWRNEIDRERNR